LAALVLVLLSRTCWADGATNTVITSKRMSYDYTRAIAVFEEDVVVVDPQMKILSDRMNVIFDKNNTVKSVTAIGNVRIAQAEKRATCNQAVYITLTGEIIMTGDPKLYRGRDSLAGTKITFWTNEDRVTCEKPHLVIFPEGDNASVGLDF